MLRIDPGEVSSIGKEGQPGVEGFLGEDACISDHTTMDGPSGVGLGHKRFR